MSNENPTPALWRVMHDTFAKDVGEIDLGDGFGTAFGDPDSNTWAAELRAVANDLERVMRSCDTKGPAHDAWDAGYREGVRVTSDAVIAHLRGEAARAEAGQ